MNEFLVKNPGAVYLLLVITAGAFIFLLKHFINQGIESMRALSESISDLYDKFNNVEHRLSAIEGEHKVYTSIGHTAKDK